MTNAEAAAIAVLLNERNQLAIVYDAARVLEHADTYRWRTNEDGNVVACVQVKAVQWYQWEISHLSVGEKFLRKGHARALLRTAEAHAIAEKARVLQCTIREGNVESRTLFESSGYKRTGVFNYSDTGNDVAVYQKIAAPAKATELRPSSAMQWVASFWQNLSSRFPFR